MALHSEFIGLDVEITDSSNKSLVGLSGKVAFETQHTFTINTKTGFKTVPKQHNSWKFQNDSVINGDLIAKRPEDRIKVKA